MKSVAQRFARASLVWMLAGIAMPSYADALTAVKKTDIQKLLKAVNASRMTEQTASLTVQALRQSLRSCTNCTQRTFDIIERETLGLFRAHMSDADGPEQRMVTTYHKHFSHTEIQQLLAFYSTPLGKRMLAEIPLIAQEGLAFNQQWARSLGPELDARLKAALNKANLPVPAVRQSAMAQ